MDVKVTCKLSHAIYSVIVFYSSVGKAFVSRLKLALLVCFLPPYDFCSVF